MNSEHIQTIRAHLNPLRRYRIELYGFGALEGRRYTATDLIVAEQTLRYEETHPFFSLDSSSAQRLMDDLYAAGIRPTEGSGSAGSMAAVQKHLEDMRSLFFEAMGVKKP